MHELAGDAGERGIALAVGNGLGQHGMPMLERLTDFAVPAFSGADDGCQPIRRCGEVTRSVDVLAIWSAVGMHARWRDDIAAIAADIEAGAKLTNAVGDPVLADAEVAMPTLPGDGFDGGR